MDQLNRSDHKPINDKHLSTKPWFHQIVHFEFQSDFEGWGHSGFQTSSISIHQFFTVAKRNSRSLGFCWSSMRHRVSGEIPCFHTKGLRMNRRELLAAGIGLGSVAITSAAALACGDNELKTDGKDNNATGPTTKYCPMFPFMFCGTYTYYYAVKYDGTICSTPSCMAGPNGLTCGCPTGDCQGVGGTFFPEFRPSATAPVYVAHRHLEKKGMKAPPRGKLTFAPGASLVESGPGGQAIYLVKFPVTGSADRFARVFQVKITKSDIDFDTLDLLIPGLDHNLITDQTFNIGHEDVHATTETPEDPIAVSTAYGANKHIFSVNANISGISSTTATPFFVTMNR